MSHLRLSRNTMYCITCYQVTASRPAFLVYWKITPHYWMSKERVVQYGIASHGSPLCSITGIFNMPTQASLKHHRRIQYSKANLMRIQWSAKHFENYVPEWSRVASLLRDTPVGHCGCSTTPHQVSICSEQARSPPRFSRWVGPG